jgi:hypothetical protein
VDVRTFDCRVGPAIVVDALSMTVKNVVLGCLVAVAIGGCAEENLCDPDQTLSKGVCYGPDAATPTVDADPMFAHFGDVCTESPECALPTAFCLIVPGAPSGYCTAVGCLADPTVCPAGWGCVDLSMYGPGLPSVCSAP